MVEEATGVPAPTDELGQTVGQQPPAHGGGMGVVIIVGSVC